MRLMFAATAAAALLVGGGTAQAARYCDPYRPFVCWDVPDPPSVTYVHPPQTTYTYRVEPAPPPAPPPPQVTYRYQVPQYQVPPTVTLQPQPAYPPQNTLSIEVK
jgi:hypothetical protein